MSQKKPLVLGDDLQLQQLQRADNLDIPLEERMDSMQCKFRTLCEWLIGQGIEVPENLLE